MGKPVVCVYTCVCLLVVGLSEWKTVVSTAQHTISPVCHYSFASIVCLFGYLPFEWNHLCIHLQFHKSRILHLDGETDYNSSWISGGKKHESSPDRKQVHVLWLCSSVLCNLVNWNWRLRNWNPCLLRGLTPKADTFTADVSTCVRNNLTPRRNKMN